MVPSTAEKTVRVSHTFHPALWTWRQEHQGECRRPAWATRDLSPCFKRVKMPSVSHLTRAVSANVFSIVASVTSTPLTFSAVRVAQQTAGDEKLGFNG